MQFNRLARSAAGALTALTFVACADSFEPSTPEASLARTPKNNAQPSIVEIAAGNPNFETLVFAVVAADLVDVLNGNRHFTVFAPTDDAFAAIGLTPATLQDALDTGALTVEQLRNILLYHVTRGDRLSQSVVGARQIRMVNGDLLFVDGTSLATPNNTANLVLSLIDIDARNGVVHVIDAVLLP